MLPLSLDFQEKRLHLKNLNCFQKVGRATHKMLSFDINAKTISILGHPFSSRIPGWNHYWMDRLLQFSQLQLRAVAEGGRNAA
jgi:hypothetical protein